jgi:uncharacterized protein
MKKRRLFVISSLIFFLFVGVTTSVLAKKKVLIYTKNGKGFVHDNIANSVKVITQLCVNNNIEVYATDDPAHFTEQNLKQYSALIFSNTNNKTFDTDEQKLALQRYIKAGGSFVGVHIASGSERDWPWFSKMVGGRFKRHPKRQDFDVRVLDKNHLSTNFLPDPYRREMDECYYLDNLNPDMHVLLAADLTTVEDEKMQEYPANTFGKYFPLAWCHDFDGGHQWYSALGHSIEHYDDPVFQMHLLGGILWAINKRPKLDYSKAKAKLVID